MKTLVTFAALSLAVPAGVAHADGSYTGNYQVKLTHDVFPTTQGYNGHGPDSTHCLALTDDGGTGWPHSGYAVLDDNLNTSGQFAVINDTILIYIDMIGSGEEPASGTFVAGARNGQIAAKGAYDLLQGGTSYDADKAAFGAKGSC